MGSQGTSADQFTLAGLSAAVGYAALTCLLLWLLDAAVLFFRRRAVWAKIPGPPGASLLLGEASALIDGSWLRKFISWTNEYPGLWRIRVLNMLWVFITDPDAAKAVFRQSAQTADQHCTRKPAGVYDSLKLGVQPAIHNILTLSETDEEWQIVRKAATPCFNSANLKRVFSQMCEVAGQVAAQLAEAGQGGAAPVDVDPLCKLYTIEVVSLLIVGRSFGEAAWQHVHCAEAVGQAIHAKLANPLLGLLPVALWGLTAEGRRHKAAIAASDAFAAARMRQVREEPPPEYTLGAALLGVRDAAGRPLTDMQLKSHLHMFLSAGFETSSHALALTMALLACHPDVQDKLEAELAGAGLLATPTSPQPRPFAWSDLGRLPYLGAVIKEGLRLLPPTPLGAWREVTRPGGITVCDYTIPPGAMVGLSSWAISRNQDLYGPDADSFRPERWLEEGASLVPEALVFSLGARDCIGQALARMEIQVALATWVGRFRIVPAPELGGRQGFFDRITVATTIQAKGGVPLLLRQRPTASREE